MTVAEINKLIQELPSEERGKVSDGYHSFEEYNKHRDQLWITLCSLQDSLNIKDPEEGMKEVWKSKLHSDGSSFEGWFVLGIGEEYQEQLTYHLPVELWEQCFFAKTLPKAPTFDGHSSEDVLNRLKTL